MRRQAGRSLCQGATLGVGPKGGALALPQDSSGAGVSTIRYAFLMMTTSSALMLEARRRAGLTQAQAAVRAGVTQSVISDYERGRREPSFAMLQRLVSGLGFSLETELRRSTPPPTLDEIRGRADRLTAALEDLGAHNVRIFGSVARGEAGVASDVDLLVDLEPGTGLFALGRMRAAAERILGAPVDIVPADGLKSDAADRIFAEAVLL